MMSEEEVCEDAANREESAPTGKPAGERLLLITVGTRGDVQPFVALGNYFVGQGHTVAIATHGVFKTFCSELGPSIEFLPLEGDPGAIVSSDRFQDTLFNKGMADSLLVMKEMSDVYTPQNMDLLWEYAQKWTPSGIITGIINIQEVNAISQKLWIPQARASTVPFYPSADTVPVGFKDASPFRFRFMNKMTHWAADKVASMLFQEHIAPFRERLGLPPTDNREIDGAPLINMFSDHVVPRPSDWPSWVMSSSFWVLPAPDDYSPPERLAAFLSKTHEKPVYMGFGSMPIKNKHHVLKLFSSVLKRIGLPGIFSGGWTDLADMADQVDNHVLLIKGAPHEWLFPQCSMAIHHGGAGTTGAALRAGIPSIVCPVLLDQFYWAYRCKDLGVGNGGDDVLELQHLTHEYLTHQIRFALSEAVITTAQELGQKLRDEDGIRMASESIINHVTQTKPTESGSLKWMDSSHSICSNPACGASFSLFKTRKNCMSCGKVLCKDCVRELFMPNYSEAQYCCDKCETKRRAVLFR